MSLPLTQRRSGSSTREEGSPAIRRLLLLLDADVLYPIRICDFILTAASLDMLHRPIVSDTILDEAAHNIVAD